MEDTGFRRFSALALLLIAVLAIAGPIFLRGAAPGADFALADFTDDNWAKGVQRRDPTQVLISANAFPADVIRAGDFVQFKKSGIRLVKAVERGPQWCVVTLRDPVEIGDGAPATARLIWRAE